MTVDVGAALKVWQAGPTPLVCENDGQHGPLTVRTVRDNYGAYLMCQTCWSGQSVYLKRSSDRPIFEYAKRIQQP